MKINEQVQRVSYLTFDLETDWGGRLPPIRDNCRGMEEGLPWLLTLLDRYHIRATFFICGELASMYEAVLRDVAERGHELALHGFSHRVPYDRLTANNLEHEVRKAKEAIYHVCETQPVGFRTPQFRTNGYLLSVLRRNNFLYDSSISLSPLSRTRYTVSTVSEHGLAEHPVPRWSVLRLPAGLLWIHRLGARWFIKDVAKSDSVIIYAHPFDWIYKRPNRHFSLKVNLWYLSVSANKVRNTLEALILGLYKQGFVFKPLRDKVN